MNVFQMFSSGDHCWGSRGPGRKRGRRDQGESLVVVLLWLLIYTFARTSNVPIPILRRGALSKGESFVVMLLWLLMYFLSCFLCWLMLKRCKSQMSLFSGVSQSNANFKCLKKHKPVKVKVKWEETGQQEQSWVIKPLWNYQYWFTNFKSTRPVLQ